MLLRTVSFKNFRNFNSQLFQLNPWTTVIIGENARGKTNLLEGVFFLINGVGFRESKEEELINYNSTGSCVVEGVFMTDEDKTTFTINIVKKNENIEKIFQIHRTKKRHIDYLKSQTRTVLFSPDQIEIITGSPDRRRDYFNKLISSYDLEYKKKLKNFEQALRRRNKILETYSTFEKLKEDLFFWDSYLVEQADYLTKKRSEYIDYLNQNKKIDGREFYIEYMKSELSLDRLARNFERELMVRRTFIGPQKDDYQIFISEAKKAKNIHHFGSRSEQRFAIFWLKMNELKFYEGFFGFKPILLLDDVFSELDLKNKKLVTSLIGKYQAIATTTEREVLELLEGPKSIIKL